MNDLQCSEFNIAINKKSHKVFTSIKLIKIITMFWFFVLCLFNTCNIVETFPHVYFSPNMMTDTKTLPTTGLFNNMLTDQVALSTTT